MSAEADDKDEREVWSPIRAAASRISAAARAYDVRTFDALEPGEHLSGLYPIALGLLEQSVELFEQIVSAFGITSGHRPSSTLTFELALDVAVRDSYDVGDLAQFIRGEFRRRRATLAEVPGMSPIVALAVCDNAIDGVRKALAAFEVAAARASHTSTTSVFAFEIDRSLAARRAYASLGSRIISELCPSADAVASRLQNVALAIEQLIQQELYADLRVGDRLLLRGAQKDLADFWKPSADPHASRAAARIAEDLLALVVVLGRVNLRQELVEHDSALIQAALDRAANPETGVFSAALVLQLQSLRGLNSELDLLLGSPHVTVAAAWLPVLAALGHPYVEPSAQLLSGTVLKREVVTLVDDEPTVKLPPGLARSILLENLTDYCASWPDQPHPALGGETPREISATAHGRERVQVLLDDMEQQAQGTPVAQACDFERLRLDLGLA